MFLSEEPHRRVKRKRQRRADPSRWERNIRKRKRASGETYINSKGKTVKGKEFVDYKCNCKFYCYNLVSVDVKKSFFDLFYTSGTWQNQVAIISGAVKSAPVNRVTKKVGLSRRKMSRVYYIPSPNGDIKVCKEMFLGTLQIDSARVHRALKKINSGNTSDQRGKHTPANKFTSGIVKQVHDHINSFPCYKSHYCRKDTSKKYLNSELNLSLMYRLFCDVYKSNNNNCKPPSQSFYENIFRKDFNLSFKPPKKDTCKKCDSYKIQLQAAQEKGDQELQSQKIAQEIHHRKVESAEINLSADKQLALEKTCNTLYISFDLQKVFPLPKITTGEAYYKRQISCYNLGLYNFRTQKSVMYLWNESIASRGPNEIASCVLNYIETHNIKKELVAWSDSCGGQNRNFKIAAIWLYIVQNPKFKIKKVIHKFPEVGHSFLPNDSEFSDIERKMKYHTQLYDQNMIADVILSSRIKKKFEIKQMTCNDFVKAELLTKALVNRKTDNKGQKIKWLQIKQMMFKKEKPGIMFFKHSHSDMVEFREVNFNKRLKGAPSNLAATPLPLIYPEGRKLSAAKIKDIKSLLSYVPPVNHQFYNNMIENVLGSDNNSAAESENEERLSEIEDEESDNEIE